MQKLLVEDTTIDDVRCHLAKGDYVEADGLLEAIAETAPILTKAQASAPDLLEALQECVTESGARCWEEHEGLYRRLRAVNDLARAAIAKATKTERTCENCAHEGKSITEDPCEVCGHGRTEWAPKN